MLLRILTKAHAKPTGTDDRDQRDHDQKGAAS